jgi:xanthine dehydrogenase accessory factor
MADFIFGEIRIAIRGGGDLGSGVAYRLFRCGFPVLITELAHPLLLRRAVSFGSAVIQDEITVEGVTARRAGSLAEALAVQAAGCIPVLVDPEGECLAGYEPIALIDARMLKRGPGESPVRPPLVIGLGPGFTAPDNCDAAVETNRGHRLGRVIRVGSAQPDTGLPGGVMGHREDRVLRAPVGGLVVGMAAVGSVVQEGQPVAMVRDRYVTAPFEGVLRGLVHDGVEVGAGVKIADVDPRADPRNSFTISEKALAVGGGAVEAMLSSPAIREHLKGSP